MGARLQVGSVVSGKYRILERLGGGGMGEVFRAEHELAGRTVALKLLRADFAGDADLTRRFFQEAQAVNKIRHPNIVDVLDAGFCDFGPYVVMECLEGATLAAALAGVGRLQVDAALAVVLPMLDALGAAHHHGIVHRDLKPANVFIARDRDEVRVKLVDFGIAKFLDAPETSPKTRTGIIFGTPDYLSPEQATGEGILDGQSDLFAVGIVLFELLTGRRPFEAANAVATAYKIVHAAVPTLAEMDVAVDPRVQGLLDRALAKAKEERFATASTFAEMVTPLVPDAAERAAALTRLLDAVLAHQPTQFLPQFQQAPASAGAPPAAPAPIAPARSGPPIERAPIRPTLASGHVPDREERLSLREPVAPHPARPPSSPRGALRSRATWTPRQLPSHVRGKCHARGTLARAVTSWVERAYGDAGRREVLDLLPAPVAESFRADGFNALVWYDLDTIDAFVEAASAHLMAGDMRRWRELAREYFDRDLGPIFRPSARVTDPMSLLKRVPVAWGKIFDFGTAKIGEPQSTARPGTERVLVRIDGFDAASLALRYACVGTTEGMLRGAPAGEASVRVLAGETSFARDFEYEVTWRKRAG